jgi:hypothetical protein
VPEVAGDEYQKDLTDDEVKTLNSIKKIDEYPLYTMTYYGDYGFDEFLKKGHTDITAKAVTIEGCSCFAALNRDGNKIHGRNHDWEPSSSVIFFTDTPKGYPTISMTVGWYVDAYLADPSEENARMLLSLPYLTLDGINEHGVVISGQNVSGEWVHDPNKISLTALEIRRMVLDYAHDLNEAVALIRQYNNLSSEGNKLLVSDAYGDSAIIEYFDGKVNVIRNQEPWQVSTNFLVKYEPPDSILDICWRYANIYLGLQSHNGLVTHPIAMDILSTAYNHTQRSAVYNMTTGKVTLCVGGKYGKIHKLFLPMAVDLAVLKTKVSSMQINTGGAPNITARIVNRSPRPSKATKVKFYLSKRRKLNAKAVLIGTAKLRALRYKKKKTVRLNKALPERVGAGEYYLIMIVDESKRNNDPHPENNIVIFKEKINILEN